MTEDQDGLAIALAALPPAPALDLICRTAVDSVGLAACAVVLMTDDENGSVAATCGPAIRAVEDLQFSLGEGPCLTAFREGVSVLVPDVSHAGARWPVFAPAAVAASAGAVFAVPLQVGAIRVGVLYLVHDHPATLAADALREAHRLARLATMVVLDSEHGGTEVLNGQTAVDGWMHRAVVHQATGMVSAQLDVELAEALARLRARAFALDRTLYDTSTDVIERRIRFSMDGHAGDSHES